MIKRLLIPLFVLGALLFAAPAQAKIVVGIGDQKAGTFDNQLWKDLKLKKVRYLTPWNVAQDSNELAELDGFVKRATSARQEVFVHFTAVRGCFNNGKYSKAKKCKLPTVKAYTSAFKAFKKRFPKIKVYGAWNEANSPSQPTYKNPKRAADYYKALKKNCKGCKVVAGDLLDTSNLGAYAKKMVRYAGSGAKLWGLHNYGDANRFRTKGTATMLKTVPGEVWVTESGGISSFQGSNLKTSEKTAGKAMKYLFSLASKFGKKRSGYRSKLTRLYPYDFGPTPADARFDASLIRPDGTARPAYTEFKKAARKAKR
jgi:Glycosyl hydrolase catalytic core